MTAGDYPQAVTHPESMNARLGPGLAYDVTTTLPQGTRANIIGVDPRGEWYQLELTGLDIPVWIYQSLATVEGSLDNVPPGLRRRTHQAPDFRRYRQQANRDHPAGGHERPPWPRPRLRSAHHPAPGHTGQHRRHRSRRRVAAGRTGRNDLPRLGLPRPGPGRLPPGRTSGASPSAKFHCSLPPLPSPTRSTPIPAPASPTTS